MKVYRIVIIYTFLSICTGCTVVSDEQSGLRNRLTESQSPYLRSAAHQPVFWQEWSNEAIETALQMDRLILLDIGAVWCHWCHVMDRESYETEELAEYINSNFIAIKVDRDERPDIDSRYQKFIRIISGQGGWPLTCILTPEGNVIYGGTYFPPEDRDGRPGLRTVLSSVLEQYTMDPDNVVDNARNFVSSLAASETKRTISGSYDESIIQSIIRSIENNFDAVNGGFGSGPKFPSGSAIELALAQYDRTGEPFLLEIAEKTLKMMANGGIHDQIGGGFHRYAVDDQWQVPHFEKMTLVNAELLQNYLHMYQRTGIEQYKEVAEGIVEYYETEMSDRKLGGFYAHQDADVSLEDDGSYFTWSLAEIEAILTPEELDIITLYYGLSEEPGEIREALDRNVLSVESSVKTIADRLNKNVAFVQQLILSADDKMRTARQTRTAPFIDKTLFASHNGLMISAYSEAYKVLKRPDLKIFALKSLDTIIESLYSEGEGFAHSLNEHGTTDFGLLVDQVWMMHALLDGFELSGEIRYLDLAHSVMQYVLDNFQDPAGGFRDRITDDTATDILSIIQKPVSDSPIASPNAGAILALDKLYNLSDEPLYYEASEKALAGFAGSIAESGLYAAAYARALLYHINTPPQVVITGRRTDPATDALYKAAVSSYRPGKAVYIFDSETIPIDRVPDIVGAMMSGSNSGDLPAAFVCAGKTCAPPTGDPEQLKEIIATFGR